MFKCTLSSYLFSMHSDIIYEWLQSAVGLPQARAVQFNSQTVTHTLSSEGSKNAVWALTFNVYKASFCHILVTIMHHQRNSLRPLHTHWAVVGLSYSCRAQQSAAAGFPLGLHNFREQFVTKSLGQNCTFLGIKTKCKFTPICSILNIKFSKNFCGWYPRTLVVGGATTSHTHPVHHHPNLTPTFKYLHGLWLNCRPL